MFPGACRSARGGDVPTFGDAGFSDHLSAVWLYGLLPATARERQRSAGVRDAWAPPNPRSQAARTVGFLIAAVGAVIGAKAGVFCGIVACDPLPQVVTAGFAHSWCVVLILPAVAVGLCVARAPKAFPSISAAALPAIAVPDAFRQPVRRIRQRRESC